jgi:hypothetical protein
MMRHPLDKIATEVSMAALDLRGHLAWRQMCKIATDLKYRVDQPRAPSGTPIGGQWVVDEVRVAAARSMAPRCDTCGGRDSTSGLVRIGNKKRCWDCTLKYLGIQNLPRDEQLKTIGDFDKDFRP